MHQEFGVERRESPPQDERPLPVLPDGPLTEIVRQAEAGYPEEICGMVVGQPGAPETYRIRQVTNIANREPQEDPGGVARDARTAYKMDPLEQLRTLREADEKGWDVVAFYHSHPDHEAYFSRMDRERALAPDGAPMWPGATYLVVSVMGGRVRGAASYRWDPRQREFVTMPVELPTLQSRARVAGRAPLRSSDAWPGGVSSDERQPETGVGSVGSGEGVA